MDDTTLKNMIVEAAIDFKQGTENIGFANEYGGLEHLKSLLFGYIDQYQSPSTKNIEADK